MCPHPHPTGSPCPHFLPSHAAMVDLAAMVVDPLDLVAAAADQAQDGDDASFLSDSLLPPVPIGWPSRVCTPRAKILRVQVVVDIATRIVVEDDGPKRSMLYIETADRPGLLLEIIKVIADTNVDVESAEIDTEGLVAKDKFHVSYRGAKLSSSLSQALINCLRYYLRRPETDEDSY